MNHFCKRSMRANAGWTILLKYLYSLKDRQRFSNYDKFLFGLRCVLWRTVLVYRHNRSVDIIVIAHIFIDINR